MGQEDAVLGGVRASAARASQTSQRGEPGDDPTPDDGGEDDAHVLSGRSQGTHSDSAPTMQLPPRYRRPSEQANAGGGSSRTKGGIFQQPSKASSRKGSTDPMGAIWRGGDDLGDPHLGDDGGVGCWPVDMMSLSDQQSRIMAQAAQAERSVHLAQLSSIHSGVMSGQWAHQGTAGGGAHPSGVGAASVAQERGGQGGADAAQDADSAMRMARVSQLREKALQTYLTELGGAVHRPEVDVRRRKLVARMQRHMGALTRPADLPSVLQRGLPLDDSTAPSERTVDPLNPPTLWAESKAFDKTPLPPHETVAAAGKAAHLRAMKALQEDAPWWLVYTPSSLVDLRDVKSAVPWRRWMAEQGYSVPLSDELGEAEREKLESKRANREEEAFGPPPGQGGYPPQMASDIWMTSACKAFGGIGSASIAADYTKDDTPLSDGSSDPPAPLSSFDAFSISTAMHRNGIVDPWAIPPGALQSKRKDIQHPSSTVDLRQASQSAGQAVKEWEAAELSTEGGSDISEGGGSANNGEESKGAHTEEDNVTEDFDFALSLLESAPLNIPSVPGRGGPQTGSSALPSLAAPGDSISDRVAAAQAALQRHTRAAASVRAFSEHDRAVAARRIQQAWRARQVQRAAQAEMHALQAQREADANAEREARWNDVYGRMAGLLRELVSDATGYTPPSQAGHPPHSMAGHSHRAASQDHIKGGVYQTRRSGQERARLSSGSADDDSQPPPTPPRDALRVSVDQGPVLSSSSNRRGGAAASSPPLSSTYPSGVAPSFRPLPAASRESTAQPAGAGAAVASSTVSHVSTSAESSGEWDGPLASSFKGPSFASGRGGILKRSHNTSSGAESYDSSARQSVSFARGLASDKPKASSSTRPKVGLPGSSDGSTDASVLEDSFGALSSVGASTLSEGGAGGVDLSLSDTGSSAVAAAIKASMPHATPSNRGASTPQHFFQPDRARRAAQPSASAHADAVAADRAAALSTPQAQVRRSR